MRVGGQRWRWRQRQRCEEGWDMWKTRMGMSMQMDEGRGHGRMARRGHGRTMERVINWYVSFLFSLFSGLC
jgi:hypothetical protein